MNPNSRSATQTEPLSKPTTKKKKPPCPTDVKFKRPSRCRPVPDWYHCNAKFSSTEAKKKQDAPTKNAHNSTTVVADQNTDPSQNAVAPSATSSATEVIPATGIAGQIRPMVEIPPLRDRRDQPELPIMCHTTQLIMSPGLISHRGTTLYIRLLSQSR